MEAGAPEQTRHRLASVRDWPRARPKSDSVAARKADGSYPRSDSASTRPRRSPPNHPFRLLADGTRNAARRLCREWDAAQRHGVAGGQRAGGRMSTTQTTRRWADRRRAGLPVPVSRCAGRVSRGPGIAVTRGGRAYALRDRAGRVASPTSASTALEPALVRQRATCARAIRAARGTPARGVPLTQFVPLRVGRSRNPDGPPSRTHNSTPHGARTVGQPRARRRGFGVTRSASHDPRVSLTPVARGCEVPMG